MGARDAAVEGAGISAGAGCAPSRRLPPRGRRRGPREGSLLHLVDEATSNRAGSEAMLAKVSEALFVDTLRRYVAALPEHQTGWLAGARDPVVNKSLAMLHSRVDHAWTIAELAEGVGVSRTALVDRFAKYLSEPPMAYLTRWRLQLAAQALTTTPRGVADIAAEVGYESEAAPTAPSSACSARRPHGIGASTEPPKRLLPPKRRCSSQGRPGPRHRRTGLPRRDGVVQRSAECLHIAGNQAA